MNTDSADSGTERSVTWAIEGEIYCPSVDVCAFCGDCECDGIGCIASLDPDNVEDHPSIEQLHCWIRLGRIQEMANAHLAMAENRPLQPRPHGWAGL